MACETLETEALKVVVGDNAAGAGDHARHRAGYNGVWSLTSPYAPENCFVPDFAGLNIEHFMDDLFMTEDGGDIFEPRHLPMRLDRLSAVSARLSQERSPLTSVSSETVFCVRSPDTLDVVFRAQLHRPPRAGKAFGFFWASYINAPESPALQFRNPDGFWCSLSPDAHGRSSGNTVCHASVQSPAFGDPRRQYNPGSLAHSFSRRRFDLPLMFGRPGDGSMLLLAMFDQRPRVRLCMSPSGGGENRDKRLFNPAWDFQYVIDEAAVGTPYQLRSRVVYKPYAGRAEAESLYARWMAELGGEDA